MCIRDSLYFDQVFRAGQSINELLEKDAEGNFLLVDKLVAIANYYGFDGYFLNKEDYPNSMQDLHEFMRQMHEKGMWTQYYDVGSSFTEEKGNWIKNGNYDSCLLYTSGTFSRTRLCWRRWKTPRKTIRRCI